MEDRLLLVLYGSETGNSQEYAELFAKKCEHLRFDVTVQSMNDCQPAAFIEARLVVIICSTTGQGDLPRNTKQLWKFLLRRKLPATLLTGMKFTTFGLGDSSYPRYNWAIRKIHKRLLQLGATEFANRGEGDEMSSEGVERMFDAWEALVAQKILELKPLANGLSVIPHEVLLPPRYTMEIEQGKMKKTGEPKEVALTRDALLVGTICSNARITATDHFQDVRHLKVDSTADISYSPGDLVALYPRNADEDVAALIDNQGWADIADRPAKVNEEFSNAIEGGLVSPLTLRTLLTHHLDIMAIPRRSFFTTAWHFSDDERERERLHEFSTLDGLDDLYDYANRPRRSILETVTEFSSLKIPVDHILDILPILRPRLFSIASSDTSENKFELAIAVVKYRTIIRRIRRGVCTRWVEDLTSGDRIPFSVVPSPLNIPGMDKFGKMDTSMTTSLFPPPVVMVGPGTGVAPMRNLIHTFAPHYPGDRRLQLFFGCRFHDKDYLFASDWKKLADDDKLDIVCAFSRDPNGGYVQDRIFADAKRVVELVVDRDGIFYVCGSAGKMPRQVRITLRAAIAQEKGWPEEEAEAFVKELERTGRYLQETW